MELNQIYNIDALEGLKQLDENSIDAIISDPPYQLTSTRVYGKETPISEISNQLKDNVEENTAYGSLIKGFMNKSWDTLPSVEVLKECLRVLKFGAWAMWLMTPRQDSQLEFLLRLRQAGFNISFSSLEWIYASGFPKAADLSLLADKKACREDLMQKLGREPTKEEFKEAWGKWRTIEGYKPNEKDFRDLGKKTKEQEGIDKLGIGITAERTDLPITTPHTSEAQALSGSYAGMQLKPARELIIVSQKPIAGKTYLDQALLHLKEPEHNQLGGTWLDDCRIPFKQADEPEGGYGRMGIGIGKPAEHQHYTKRQPRGSTDWGLNSGFKSETNNIAEANPNGRFPANIIVSDNALSMYSEGALAPVKAGQKGFGGIIYGKYDHAGDNGKTFYSDKEVDKSISRYFDLDFWFENKLKELPEEQQKIFPFLYVPKASKSERNKGLENLPETLSINGDKWTDMDRLENNKPTPRRNIHPTTKPIKLMSYLITLTTRENNIVLDPFIGSGTTAISSILLKRRFIGFEREAEYYKIATERIKYYQKQEML